MKLSVCSWGLTGICPQTRNIELSNGIIFSRSTSRTNEQEWLRHNGWESCRWSQNSFAQRVADGVVDGDESVCRRRRKMVITNASKSKSKRWKEEPLINGSVTRRAMHIVKTLRASNRLRVEDIDATLQKWVTSMQPNRKDWLTVLREFDNKLERLLYFKISEWGNEQSWFEAGLRDYTKLLDKYGKEGNLEGSERTLRSMENNGIVPDIGTYTALIAAYGRAKMIPRVQELVKEVSLAGLDLDAVFYKTMIVAYGSAGLLQEAEETLTSMEAAEVPGGNQAYIALLTAYGRRGLAKDAQKIFDRMHLNGFRGDLKAFTALMEAYSNAEDYSNAELIFQSMRAAKLKPDDRALSSLISMYASGNMLQRGVEVLVEFEKAVGPVTLTSLIGWFGRAGLVEEAEHCFQELKLKRLPLSGNAYASMFAAYARAGELALAESVWAAIEEEAVVLDDRACGLIVDGLAAGPFPDEQQKIVLSELVSRGWDPPLDLRVARIGELVV